MLYFPKVHVASLMLVDMVVESRAYRTLSTVISGMAVFEYRGLTILMRFIPNKILKYRLVVAGHDDVVVVYGVGEEMMPL